MASTAKFVQIVACEYFILGTVFKQLQSVLSGLALKHVKVLDDELILLRPADA